MNYSKTKWAQCIPCLLAAVSMLAMAAPSARAEGNWLVEGKAISGTVELTVEKEKGPYSFLVPAQNFELVFANLAMDDGLLFKGGTSLETLLFTEGSLYTISPLELVSCKVGNLTFKLKGHLFLHGGKTYYLLEPEEGTVLTVTTYSNCPLPEEVLVTGTLVLEDANGEFETEAIKHQVRQAPAELFPSNVMKFGKNEMRLDGSAWLKLAGANEGKKWSAVG